jgi:hypothetical protein
MIEAKLPPLDQSGLPVRKLLVSSAVRSRPRQRRNASTISRPQLAVQALEHRGAVDPVTERRGPRASNSATNSSMSSSLRSRRAQAFVSEAVALTPTDEVRGRPARRS